MARGAAFQPSPSSLTRQPEVPWVVPIVKREGHATGFAEGRGFAQAGEFLYKRTTLAEGQEVAKRMTELGVPTHVTTTQETRNFIDEYPGVARKGRLLTSESKHGRPHYVHRFGTEDWFDELQTNVITTEGTLLRKNGRGYVVLAPGASETEAQELLRSTPVPSPLTPADRFRSPRTDS